MVGKLVVGDVWWQKVSVSVVEHRLVDGVPCEFSTVFAVIEANGSAFWEEVALALRGACKVPEVPLAQVYSRFCTFKVVDI